MSVATRPPGRPGPADRLPRPTGPHGRAAEIRLGVAGVLGILVLLAGIPAALVIFVGYPLPRSAPSHAWLTQAITATLLIKILACVVWLVWAHFVVCLLAEWRALRRGRLPGSVPFGGGSQALARRLVAAALLLGGAATVVPHGAGSHSAPPRPAAVAAQHAAGAATGATPETSADPQAAPQTEHSRAAQPTKYYVVQPPHGRRYDSLWDIAERTLHDPLRYKEIFALNKDRTQPDGSKLVDANLIRPGWELRLPADASGPGVHVLPAKAPRPATGSEPTEHAGEPATRPAAAAHAAVATHGAAAVPQLATSAAAARHAAPDSRTGEIALGGGLMLAGLLLALSSRRGPYVEPSDDEQALGLGADPGLAAAVDRALRNLAAARREQQRALPQPIVAWADADTLALNLAGGDLADPPGPWTADDDGRTWSCPLGELVDHPALADTAAPYPGLLSVGRHDGWELFVDFEQAPGVVGVCGELAVGREFVTALAVQAATSVWSDGARVHVVGFGDGAELAALAPQVIQAADGLGDVLDGLEQDFAHLRQLQEQLGVDGVLTGRLARRDDAWRPTFVLMSGPPNPDELHRLQQLAGDGRSNLVAVTVGDTPAARWRFVLDAAGRLDLGVLGASAQAHRVGRAATAQLAELFRQAETGKRQQGSAVAALTPARAVRATSGDAPAVRRTRVAAPVATVSLLGPVTIDAPGPIDDPRRELGTEIAVAVALHPAGLHDAVLRASIWPRGVSDEVCAAALADVRAWLGRDAAGRPNLSCEDGRWRLGDAVAVDLDELRRLSEASAGPDELAGLLRAVGLFRGRLFSGTPAGRYGWLAFARAAREARVLATAVSRRAAALFAERGDLAQAEQVLRAGLVAVPESEPLWRELLVLVGGRGPEPAGAVVDEMYATLRGLHIWPDPETDALAGQLAPGRVAPRTA